jgi:hypothetical protein
MKLKALALSTLSLAALFTGCWQKSVHPFYHEKDLVFEPALLGTWNEPDKKPEETETWTFTRSGRKSLYRVDILDGETKLEFDGALFQLGDNRFLDLYSRKRSANEMPAHHLLRIRNVGSALQVQMLGLDWVRDRMRTHPNEIGHILVADSEHPDDADKGEAVLTAGTELLQKFVRDHLDAMGFFDDPVHLKKAGRP